MPPSGARALRALRQRERGGAGAGRNHSRFKPGCWGTATGKFIRSEAEPSGRRRCIHRILGGHGDSWGKLLES
jgi:hypothetical protein